MITARISDNKLSSMLDEHIGFTPLLSKESRTRMEGLVSEELSTLGDVAREITLER